MDEAVVLSKFEDLGSVVKCPKGVIHVHYGYTTLRFCEQSFVDFALMVKSAFSTLSEDSLKQIVESSDSQS